MSYSEKNKNNNEQKVSLIFQLNIDYKTIFSARGIVFVRSAFWHSVLQMLLGLQTVNLVMHFKMDFDETTQ